MSYTTEHRRMKPILDQARAFNVANNPAPQALFDPLRAGFNIWCTPDDHPDGWESVTMLAGAFAKPCDFVASVYGGWTDARITHLTLSTAAYALRNHENGRARAYLNRPDDIAWAKVKTAWLFTQAHMSLPTILITDE